jgi:anti-sigma-K factor RskA
MHIADTDLTLYAMGALADAEMQSARAHVSSCAKCKEELRQIELALAAYAQATPEVDIPPGAKQRFMARVAQNEKPIETPAAARRSEPAPIAVAPRRTWFVRWGPAMAGALALLLVVVGYDDVQERIKIRPLLSAVQNENIKAAQYAEIMELLTSGQAQRVALHEAPSKTPPPEGRVIYSARNGKLLLTAQNLHPLPMGKVYELWILQPNGGKPLPAGTFAPDSRGNAAMILADEPANLAVAGFGITVENEGGALTPTPPIVLSGQ